MELRGRKASSETKLLEGGQTTQKQPFEPNLALSSFGHPFTSEVEGVQILGASKKPVV